MSKYFLLWLEGPMQSWGFDSQFNRRDTLDFPTKSAILGMICCARGAGGEQSDWLRQWANTDMRVIAYAHPNPRDALAIKQPLLTDFHMVGSGYHLDDPWESMMVPKTSEGKKAVGGGTKLTYRYYLQDVKFAVILEGTTESLAQAQAALNKPVWDIYLGRKCCAPTDFIARGIFDSMQQAQDAAAVIAEQKSQVKTFEVMQGRHEGEVLTLNDVPLQFGSRKRYTQRMVTIVK